jgi:hypothetical protein
VDLYRWVFQLLGDPFFMELHQEWRSPDFHSAGAIRYELLILLFPVVLALARGGLNLVGLGLSFLWLHLALTGFRYVALWVVVTIPLMARASVTIPYLLDLARRLQLSAGPTSLFHTHPTPPSWLCSAVIAVALVGGVKVIEGRFAVHKQEIIASDALDRFIEIIGEWKQEHGRMPRILHNYDWGGYLTWHGWPEVLNWIDDRNEVQGKKHIQDYFEVMKAGAGWQEKLAHIDLVCIDPSTDLARQLRQSAGWRERFRDPHAVIFERRVGR